jgi:lysozyme
MIPKQHRNKAAAIAIVAVLAPSFEGLRHTVYRDSVGVPTYCIGETKHPRYGHVYSTQECTSIFEGRIVEFANGVENCTTVDMSPKREAAMIDLAYNIGVRGYCHSTVVRKLNAGDVRGACDALLGYNHAGGITFPGLTRRREAERKLCLEE